jgi:hypothetical protein
MHRLAILLFALVCSFVVRAAPPNDAVVTFNEIHYHPAGATEAGEFVELANLMGVNVDLSGWRISGGIDYKFPNGTVIPGGGRVVVAKTMGLYANSYGPFTGSLDNSGETLRLRDNNDRVMDEITYADSGTWPIAPDGSGVSLAKRDPYTNSAEAASWGSSTQIGGTPGDTNFPLPPAPTLTRFVDRFDPWKYNTSGTVPANWNTSAFDDSGWSSGPGALQFGTNVVVYGDAVPPVAGGQWFVKPWTGDADSEISTAKGYTHKIGFNHAGAYTAINGVTFDSPGSGIFTGASWSLTGANISYTGNVNGTGANNLPAGSGSKQLCEEFFYGASNGGATSRLTIGSLTEGQTYIATFYAVGFGGPLGRQVRITPADSGVGYLIDENLTDSGNGLLVKYRYVAPGSGTMTFDFQDTANATWHHYAFSNETAPAVPVQSPVNTTTVSLVTSEFTASGFSRAAANCVNGSGLTNGQHGTTADGAMWLSNGNVGVPADPLPAEITFDLGETVDLAGFQVWNYNEANALLLLRGAKDLRVQTSATTTGAFITRIPTMTLRKGLGVASEPGERFDLNVPGVRRVKFIINTSYGDTSQLVGLSEVKFFKQGLAPSGPPPLVKEAVTTIYNTGVNANGSPSTVGAGDTHWSDVATGQPALVMNGNPAWYGLDGNSQWIGPVVDGNSNAPAGQLTYRTTFSLADYDATGAEVRLYVAADNNLDGVLLNGSTRAITAAGFASLLGPYTISGPFNPGSNNVDFRWTNLGPGANPAGLRVKWDAVAPPHLGKTSLPANPITTYLRRSFNHTGNPSSTYRVLLNFVADDGAVFYLNGTEIYRTNLPAGGLTASTLATTEILYPKYNGVIEVPAAALLPGQPNVFAVELHQASAGNADAFFLATLDIQETPAPISVPMVRFSEIASAQAQAGTFFVEIQNNGAAVLLLNGYQIRSTSGLSYTLGATNLAAGALLSLNEATLGFRPADGDKLFLATTSNGIGDAVTVKNAAQARNSAGAWLVPNAATPGGANTFALNTSVVINEIMYHHMPAYLATGTVDSPEQWVELYNRTASPVTLTGWKLRGGLDYDFTPGTQIPANGYLVIAVNPTDLHARYPLITVVGPASGSLSSSEDIVRLEDAVGNPVNEVHYYDDGRWDGRADGGGSSLELRNPGMDNSGPEAWAASDESGKANWTNVSYSGPGTPFPGTSDPASFHEFILGLVNGGECLVDDVSVKEVSQGNRELIQNGTFDSGTAKWRNLGNHGSHGRTVAVSDGGNNVLKIVATGPAEHMHNHCETTFASGITTNPASTYNISFRARWVSGCPRLQSRLYFNVLARQTILDVPTNVGTPGAPNSRSTALVGPTFSGLTQSPTLPLAQETATLRVAVADPQGVASVAIQWKADGAATWNAVPMTLTDGAYQGNIPGQNSGALIQFYIEASDGVTTSTFPAAGPNSRAFIRWKDLVAPTTPGHGIRILMATADADFMHAATNVMSNDGFPCTVVYRESEFFYDATVRLKSSERGRFDDRRVGFALQFDPMHKFRGAHTGITIDRSGYGRGTTGNGYGHSEIVSWHMFNRAKGVPSMYNDMIYVIAPRAAHTGSGILTMAEFNDVWADSQYDHGADYPGFKYELIYSPTTTDNGLKEGLKLPQPDEVRGVEFGSITSPNKEAFRWNFLIGNARGNDDFTRLINLSNTYQLTGTAFNNAIVNAIDVDEWLRASAAMALAGIGDNYATTSGAWHNLKLYHRPDGRILYLPWDLDFQSQPFNDSLIINPDIGALIAINPSYQRLFYQHLQDIINTSFNSTYLAPWVSHYSTFSASGGNWNDILTYVDQRVAFVQNAITQAYPFVPFDITTPDFSTSGSSAVVSGNGWIDVRNIVIQAGGLTLPVTWTTDHTWQVTVPVSPGANAITLQAFDYQGKFLFSDTINITGSGGTIPAAAGTLAISEIHYNPLVPTGAELNASTDKDEFEFLEVRNTSATQTVSLAGCRFTGGVDYTFPNTTVAPGGYAVIPRNSAAFAARYTGVATLPHYYVAGGNFLSNSGDELTLLAANGNVIAHVIYQDSASVKWPASADGAGRSLVLIAPMTNPDENNPLHWRASAANHGNPGTSDALAPIANPGGDSDGNGIKNMVEHALGSGAMPKAGTELVGGLPHLTFTLERNPLADTDWSLENTADLKATWTPADDAYQITTRTLLPNGVERITLRSTNATSATGQFLRGKIRVP